MFLIILQQLFLLHNALAHLCLFVTRCKALCPNCLVSNIYQLMFLSIIISCIQVLRNDTLPKAYRLVGNLYSMVVFSKDRA